VDFITSGPVVAMVWEGDGVIASARKLIGATNPENAEEGTIRKKYAESVEMNAVHGSDSDENANLEADFFFARSERTDCM
jgi:nucleoside-diphosphate kinase